LKPRSTAEGAASFRAAGALEADPAVRCPDEMAAGFLSGINVTTLAKYRLTQPLYVRLVNRLLPGAYAYEIARCKFIDEVTLSESEAGVDEVVLLGAGLDSRPYRLGDRLEGLRVFEVDHPASQVTKLARLRRVLGTEPADVRFVPLDFTREDLGTHLAAVGHDEGAPTLFIFCGVSPYLPAAAVEAIFAWVGGHTSPQTSIVFDAVRASVLGGQSSLYGARELQRAVERAGEPLRWGIPDGKVHETLQRFGLCVERELDPEAVTAAYLTRTDGSALGAPYGFGVLVHARVVPA
jgi:methyltransferase (TIGR00027 family)